MTDKEIEILEIDHQKDEYPSESVLPYILGDTIEDAEEVYQKYEKYLNKFAESYSKVYGNVAKYDLFIEALLALGNAVSEFDSTRSDDFRTFALTKIKDALDTYIRRMNSVVSIPAYISKAHSIMKRLYNETSSEKEREHAIEMLNNAANRAGLKVEELKSRALALPSTTDYDQTAEYNLIDDSCVTKKATAILAVEKLFSRLKPIEKTIAEMLMDGLIPTDIADCLGMSRSAISQHMKHMRNKLKSLGLELKDII